MRRFFGDVGGLCKKENQLYVALFGLAHKQCNSIIKSWLHCLTSVSKGRFLANNILLARCLVMAQIKFCLIKEK